MGNIEFTGERVVLGKSPAFLEVAHIARYQFASTLVKDKVVVDLGCGSGYGSKILAEAGASQVIGIDIDPEAIAFCQKEYTNPNLSFHTADAVQIEIFFKEKLPDLSPDVIVCFEVIEHLIRPLEVIGQLRQILKSGGKLIISTPNRDLSSPHRRYWEEPQNQYHVREFARTEFSKMLTRQHFSVVGVYGQAIYPRYLIPLLRDEFYKDAIKKLADPDVAALKLLKLHQTANTLTFVAGDYSPPPIWQRIIPKGIRITRQLLATVIWRLLSMTERNT